MTVRHEVGDINIEHGMTKLREKLNNRLQQYGRGIFVSRHEILGIIQEEMDELNDAVRDGTSNDISEELLDIAIAAVWGYISIQSLHTDW